MTSWYATKSAGGQGIVADEDDGRDVAISYNEEDALLLAAAPTLLEQLRQAELTLRHAVQEADGKVEKEIVVGWLYCAEECRRAIYDVDSTPIGW